jgi:acyl-CoA thioesterase
VGEGEGGGFEFDRAVAIRTEDGAALGGFEFDRAVAIRTEDGAALGEIDPGWNIGDAPNGGYLCAIAVSGLLAVVEHPDPLAVSAHFPSRPRIGPVEVETELVRTGRSQSTALARLVQEGEPRVVVTATFGDLGALEGPTVVRGSPPEIPPPEQCVRAEGPVAPVFTQRFDLRMTPESAMWAVGQPSGEARMEGWIRFADGRDADPLSLVVFCDSFPPTVFNVLDLRTWVPTIEYTVHVRAKPRAGWLQCRFTTRYLIGGYLEEDGEVWDSSGHLVALSRQLARVLQPR